LPQFFFVGIDVQDVVGKMDELGLFDHFLARSAGNVDLIVVHPLPVHPECEGSEPAGFREIFRDPRAVCAERFGEILDERGEKPLSCFRRRSFENRQKGGVRFQAAQRAGIVMAG
jgi:hypothetical protein